MKQDRIVKQVDKMVKSGRITDEEAERLRATEGTDEFEPAVTDIRVRHASAQIDAAVSDGQMSQEEADGYFTRLKSGEHPRELRSHLAQLRKGQPK